MTVNPTGPGKHSGFSLCFMAHASIIKHRWKRYDDSSNCMFSIVKKKALKFWDLTIPLIKYKYQYGCVWLECKQLLKYKNTGEKRQI